MNRYYSPREGSKRAREAEERGLGPGAFAALPCGRTRGPGGTWRRVRPFKWLDFRPLWASRNDRLARLLGDPTNAMRARWVRHLAGPADDPERLAERFRVEAAGGGEAACLVIGDTGEGDASQCAVVPQLLEAAPGTAFLFICSDVIYPAGDASDYPAKFYGPYAGYAGPIYAVPGNHDWYDELCGFAFHLCDADPPPGLEGPELGLIERLLWRRPRRPSAAARRARERRPPGRRPQPGPYLALDLGPVLLVGIDTGIEGGLDAAQGRWLRHVSASVDKPKVLLTGKPLYVDGQYHPGTIEGLNATVDDIVTEPAHRYVAAIGGDIHNYQRYPVRLEDGRVIEYIVSGGGGAFMHATHRIPHVDLGGVSEDGADPDPVRGDGFRCFPLRGDSIAFYSRAVRRALRQLIRDALLAGAGFAAACAVLLALAGIRWWSVEAGVLLALPAAASLHVIAYLARIGAFEIAFGPVERLTGEEGAAWIAARIGTSPTLGRSAELDPRKARLAELIAPRFHRIGGFLHSYFSEIMDIDEPPLYKQFLRLDARPGELVISCYAAIGTEAEGDPLALEDQVTIPLPPAGRVS